MHLLMQYSSAALNVYIREAFVNLKEEIALILKFPLSPREETEYECCARKNYRDECDDNIHR